MEVHNLPVNDYSKYENVLPVKDLTLIQQNAWERFLQANIAPSERKNIGLESLFREHFPVATKDGEIQLQYLWYTIGQPRYSPEEAKERGWTYGAPLKARLRLVHKEVIEEDVYLGEIPLMVGGGEFIINGVERIVVSQLHRSPGIDFLEQKIGDKVYQYCWIIPERGSWIEISVTKKESLAIKIDQGNKIPVTIFLRAISPELSTSEAILKAFYPTRFLNLKSKHLTEEHLAGKITVKDIIDPETQQTIIPSGKIITEALARYILSHPLLEEIEVVDKVTDNLVLNTLEEDTAEIEKVKGKTPYEKALIFIYSKLRPGSPPSVERAKQLLFERFFDPNRYRLSKVGRFRINRKFNSNIPEEETSVRPDDIVNAIKYLIKLRAGEGDVDDIDNLGNRRVRTIDELATEEIRKGFIRLKRSIMERLSLGKDKELTPKTLVNSKAISSAIEYFFMRDELSQVVDQTNPISQITHERRLSALGPGGLNRKRAGFEVRDVQPSHYGRICPIETPEGTNIGLIVSLSLHSKIDEYGFITTPYRIVRNGKVTNEVVYLRANEEQDKKIAPADTPIDKSGRFKENKVMARLNGEFTTFKADEIDFIDVSPMQMLSLSASLIPFLEHDDANRALMGSNMQRQAVPLIKTTPPLVATGMEKSIAENSSMVVKARKSGTVKYVSAEKIIIGDDVYNLKKFEGLNDKTTLNQKPIVNVGQSVKAGQVIADGAATCLGELALGKNILVALMPWEGYNFEDAIVASENLIKDDIFTSIHIEELECEIRETKLGKEEFTRDIPNVSEKFLKNLGEDGIVLVGSRVRPGDILVGKVTPQSKSELTPEEKLIRQIFGKAGEDVKNKSLEAPPGIDGIVLDVKKFSRRLHLTQKEKEEIKKATRKIEKEFNELINNLLDELLQELKKLVGAKNVPDISVKHIKQIKDIEEIKSYLSTEKMNIEDAKLRKEVEQTLNTFFDRIELLINKKENKINQMLRGDELPTGVLGKVKIYIAMKRNLQVGDKLAGRHGNKGVVSKILPREDMPFLQDGTPVDILFNPLGVPSRMNVGQLFEMHLGIAAKKLGIRVITPVFAGCSEEDVQNLLEKADLPQDGKFVLRDGRTGEPFKDRVTVGYMYVMKLHHLVEDKIHARATGPYSLITQQPLGGKARYGGQRFGEMEVWALESYGAASILQELLTVKSDDVDGRTRIYEAMIKGENILEPGMPISFEVLTNEIKGLALSVKLEKSKLYMQ